MSAAAIARLASSTDWDTYRPIITDLYEGQGKTLKEASAIMQSEHGFLGTPKTYKTRFEKWGLQKNFRSKQVAEILHQKTAREAAGKETKILVRGKEVPDKRLKTYLRRTTKKPQSQLRENGVETSTTPGSNRDMVPIVLCRTPSPGPSSSPQKALLGTNSPPMWDENTDQEFTLHSGVYPSPYANFPDPPSIPELWDPWQDDVLVAALSDQQESSASSSSPGVFKQSQPSRSVISCRRASATPDITHLFPLAMPEVLGKPEECIYLVRDYVSERFDSASWRLDNFKDGLNEVVDWYNEANSAVSLLWHNQNKQALKILDRSFSQYRKLVATPNYILFFYTCNCILDLSGRFQDLATTFIRHARDVSQFELNGHHPLGKLLEKMCLMDMIELRQSLRQILDCYSEHLESKVDPGSESMIQVTVSRCKANAILDWEGLLDFSVTEAHMKRSLKAIEQYGDLGRGEVLDIKYRLAELYYHKDNFDEARSIISEVLASADPDEYYDLARMDNCYELLSRISREVGSHDEIVDSMNQCMSFAKAHFRSGDRYIHALSAWEEYLREIEDADLADKTFQEMDTAVEELCVDFEEFLDLDADEGGS